MKKLVFVMLVFAFSNYGLAQNLNGYRYASVPSKFSAQKKKNQYNLNAVTKVFLQQYGFEAYLDTDNVPFEFSNNNCSKVFVDVEENNSLFLTRLKVVLKDCNGKVLYTSREVSSKTKDLNTAYNESLREALRSLRVLNYKYDVRKSMIKAEEPKSAPVVVEAETVVSESQVTVATLYAQAIANGFQLVNSEPKVIMKIYKTSNSDIYAAVKGDKSGVFIPKDNGWFFEYYENEKLISEKVDVKF